MRNRKLLGKKAACSGVAKHGLNWCELMLGAWIFSCHLWMSPSYEQRWGDVWHMPWLPATVHTGPHRAASLSRRSSNGRGKIVCLSSGFVAAVPALFCFQNLGFSLERHITQARHVWKSSGSQTGQQRSRGAGRARVHEVLCLCRVGFLHFHCYEQSMIRKWLLNSSQVLAFYAHMTLSMGSKAMILSVGPLRSKPRARILVLSFK